MYAYQMSFWTEPGDWIFVTGYGFLFFCEKYG